MTDRRLYLIAGAILFVELGVLAVAGPSVVAWALLAAGVTALVAAVLATRRRTRTIGITIEDDHIHPIPVLDAPKGTYDLIAGMAVRVDNRHREPIGVKIDAILYRRTPWQWDRRLEGAGPATLLPAAVVAGRSAKSFLARSTIRLPAGLDTLTTDHFVKLIVETSQFGKSIRRVFLRERFELPTGALEGAPQPAAGGSGAPLLPFSERPEAPAPAAAASSARARLGAALRRLLPAPRGEAVKIHRLRRTEDSLKGLIDELNAEIDEELGPERAGGRPESGASAAGGAGSSSSGGR